MYRFKCSFEHIYSLWLELSSNLQSISNAWAGRFFFFFEKNPLGISLIQPILFILSRCFLIILVILKAVSSSAYVKFPGLMSRGCSMTCSTLVFKMSGTFPKRFIIWYYNLFNLSVWLLAFNLDSFVLFLPLILLTVYQLRTDRLLSAAEFISRIFPGCIQDIVFIRVLELSKSFIEVNGWIWIFMTAFSFTLALCYSMLFESQGMCRWWLGFKGMTSFVVVPREMTQLF